MGTSAALYVTAELGDAYHIIFAQRVGAYEPSRSLGVRKLRGNSPRLMAQPVGTGPRHPLTKSVKGIPRIAQATARRSKTRSEVNERLSWAEVAQTARGDGIFAGVVRA